MLLGDAAHAMTPDLGQGGGEAMEDAATLAALLGPVVAEPAPDSARLDAALARYDVERRRRTQPIARRSRASSERLRTAVARCGSRCAMRCCG